MKKADIITITQTLPHVAHMGSVTVLDKIITVEIKVITYQDEIKLEIGTYIWIRIFFSNNAVMCDPSGTILGKPT